MADIVRAVNFIRSCRINHKQLKAFLHEAESEYGDTVHNCQIH